MKATPQTFPYREAKPGAGVGALLRRGSVTTLLGQVHRIDVGWAGRLRCVLKLSMGMLTVVGTRESIPLAAKEGDWLSVRALRSHSDEEGELRVLSARITMPTLTTAWLPTALYHREVHMRRLRALLLKLEPELQAVFMLCMSDAQVQRAFFSRVAAADHHCYPGGLFDQSVRAAELAHAQHYASERQRGVATLAALLFDLGKVSEGVLRADSTRCAAGLTPHPLTARRLERALAVIEPLQPAMTATLRSLLAPAAAEPADPTLAQQVSEAVQRSWEGVRDA